MKEKTLKNEKKNERINEKRSVCGENVKNLKSGGI
jgi:hypothetical protein